MATSRVLSIEVTDEVTRVIEVDYGKKDPVVHKAVVFQTPEKTVSDGVIEGVETLAKEFKRMTHGFGTKNAIFTLATNKVMSREVSIPEMKDDQIPDFISNQKSEYFPMDTSGHTIVHRILDRDKEKKQIRIIIYAVPQKLTANYQAFASLAGLNVVSIDYNGNSIYQWLSNDNHKEMDMYLQINERSTLFTVMEKRKFAIQRNINFGVYALADRLIQSGYYDSEDMGESLTRTEALKKLTEEELLFPSFAAIKLGEPDSESAERLHNAKEQVTEAMRQLIGNLSRVLEYYHSKNQNAELNTIYIGGRGASVKGLKSFLENEFSGVEIVALDQLPDAKISSTVSKSGINTSELIACLGAAEGSLTFVQVSEESKKAKFVFVSAIAVMVAIAGGVALFFLGKGKVNSAENDKSKIEYDIHELEGSGIEELEANYNRAQSMVSEVYAADDSTYRYSEQWNDVLKSIEEKAVSSMVVTSVSSNEGGVVINMSVGSKEAAAKLLLQFAEIPYFSKVSIKSLSESFDEVTLSSTVTFSVNCTYKKFFDQDINQDGKIDESDDINGDGTVNKLDKYGDYNHDGFIDRRDVEAAEKDEKADKFKNLKDDINGDGIVDVADDINGDGTIDSTDKDLFILLEAGFDITELLNAENTEEGAQNEGAKNGGTTR